MIRSGNSARFTATEAEEYRQVGLDLSKVRYQPDIEQEGTRWAHTLADEGWELLAAGHYALLEETFEIARALQPALVVLEDVDLVGGHRDGPWARGGSTLNMLLNEMDGLAPEARMLFVC